MDVTLACADGSTLDAHKVILSSVSSYFRDILKVHHHKETKSILLSTDAVKRIMIHKEFSFLFFSGLDYYNSEGK